MIFFVFGVFYFSMPLIYGFEGYEDEENRNYPKDSYEEQYSDMNDVSSVESGNNLKFKSS